MQDWISSIRLFLWGLFKRSWTLLIGLGLGVLDAVEVQTGRALNVPDWAIWTALVAGLFASAIWTFHDLRMDKAAAEGVLAGVRDRRDAVRRVAAQQEKGLNLRVKMLAAGNVPAAEALYDPWFNETVSILGEVAPEYGSEFRRAGWIAVSVDGVSDPKLSDLIVRLDWRVARLGDIVRALNQSVSPATP